MRTSTILAALAILLADAGTAQAHAITGDAPLALRLAHQLISPHHLPLLVIALLAGIGVLIALGRSLRRRSAPEPKRRP